MDHRLEAGATLWVTDRPPVLHFEPQPGSVYHAWIAAKQAGAPLWLTERGPVQLVSGRPLRYGDR